MGTLLFCLILVSSSTVISKVTQSQTNQFLYNVGNLKLIGTQITNTAHSPISIDGNQNFSIMALNEGWNGDGSKLSPYEIKGLEITNSTVPLIEIKNTDVYFTISGNTLNGVTEFFEGIFLENVTNALVESNDIQLGHIGIKISKTSNISISKNIISNCATAGIYSTNSESNDISGNTIKKNGDGDSTKEMWEDLCGIYFQRSSSNIIANNIITENYISGITLDASSWNIIDQNTVDKTYWGIWLFETTSYNIFSKNTITNCDDAGFNVENYLTSHNLVTENIFYDNNGGLGFGQGTNNTASSNIFHDNEQAISLGYEGVFAKECTIEHNIIYNNTNGINLVSTEDCIIKNNSIYTNENFGLEIEPFSSGNTIKWNDFIANNLEGDSQAKDDGTTNTFTSNYWYEWTDSNKPYEISGTAGNTDSSPLASKNNPDSPDITAPKVSSGWLIPLVLPVIFAYSIIRKIRKD